MILGAIGDDFTGSSDLGLTLAAGGMQTIQFVGVPDVPAPPGVEAGIVALKSRSVPAPEAVRQSLAALDWLRAQGCRQFLFKYCSTFDSTPEGNIGPVIEALVEALDTTDPVIVCPAFPATGRTVYQGHLFVGDRLLSESGMERHPVTPMTDADLRRWLARQMRASVGHLPLRAIREGHAREGLLNEAAAGRQVVVCDAVADSDLLALGEAGQGFALITGGSGIALGLPRLLAPKRQNSETWQGAQGAALALSGSCSAATRAQIAAHAAAGGAQRKVEVADLVEGRETAARALAWAQAQDGLPLVYTSDDPAQVAVAQERFGDARAASLVEGFFAELAAAAVDTGVTRLIVAGGETSGAVTEALGAKALAIGPMIDPGVPALRVQGRPLALALKSGNFGAPDFFLRAARVLEGT
ncbi:3-oxo-tetronate kinase [Rubellimicrobium roseum]|uniref:3-oxo-tetronate kinase n=1 Tax=Rubellimicrobium roseum TaxID=687525 RepID=A0A5C4N4L8_9RHOB|nr:3-oxo-tetronate kinase [Rubellimicrobium roseum]TNC63094.1 four-carbon acid sugar kinase family protein [Rubellimicrobium roseum]